MLVLTVKDDDALTITTPLGEEIQFRILTARPGRARVGVIAPDRYRVGRSERRKQAAPKAADGDGGE